MTFLQELRAFLLTSSGVVTAVVDNVYNGPKPENLQVLTWISLLQSGGSDLEDMSGLEGTTKARIQISCFSTSDPGISQALRDVVRAFLGNYRGAMGSVTVTGINDAGTEFDYYAPEILSYCSSRDFYIWYGR